MYIYPVDISEEKYKQFVNKTDRSGRFGGKLIYDTIASEYIKMNDFVLDYGCGKNPNKIKKVPEGIRYIRVNHDIGANAKPSFVNYKDLNKAIDLMIVSNVLNVQPSVEYMIKVLSDIAYMIKGNGKCIANYPISPRHAKLSVKELFDVIEGYRVFNIEVIYNTTKKLHCKSSAPVLLLTLK